MVNVLLIGALCIAACRQRAKQPHFPYSRNIATNASVLFSAYEKDKAQAAEEFEGATARVSGTVIAIERRPKGDVVLLMHGASRDVPEVACDITGGDPTVDMGGLVAVTGVVRGLADIAGKRVVVLESCRIYRTKFPKDTVDDL